LSVCSLLSRCVACDVYWFLCVSRVDHDVVGRFHRQVTVWVDVVHISQRPSVPSRRGRANDAVPRRRHL